MHTLQTSEPAVNTNCSDHGLPGNSNRSNMLGAEGGSDKERSRRRTNTDLEIAEDIFTDEAVRRFFEEWLVPVIVDRRIRNLMNSSLQQES